MVHFIKHLFLLLLLSLLMAVSVTGTKAQDTTGTRHDHHTFFQTAREWMPEINVEGDVAIIYGAHTVRGKTLEQRKRSWQQHGYATQFMTGIAWGNYGEYFSGGWDGTPHWEAGQVNRQGDTLWHNKGLIPYIVPVSSYVQYFKEKIIKKVIDTGLTTLYLEEPEFWTFAGYSEGFKEEWVKYYGFPWRPQHISAENAYLSNKLKYRLYYRALKEVSDFAVSYGRQQGKEIRVLVPTHSLINYLSFKIVSPEASLASLPGISGYIAQVWTGTARVPQYFNGKLRERVFENAFLEYGCMASMIRPVNREIIFLTDPIEDRARDWADYEKNYEATFAAQLLYPSVNKFEVMPWPSRIYMKKYKTEENGQDAFIPESFATRMQVMIHALGDMPLTKNKVNGTHGIAVLMHNSIMFQRFPVFKNSNDPHASGFYGQVMPLLKRGVPVEIVHMENLQFKDALKGVKVLIMSYSNMKPSSPDQHRAIAGWVKNGGTLIYCSADNDPFQKVREWWNTGRFHYDKPAGHLFGLLGLELNEAPEGVKVGKGKVYVMRQNPGEFVEKTGGDSEFINIVRKAYAGASSGKEMEFKNHFLLRRGKYVIASVMDESVNDGPLILTGRFIDLFDPSIPVVKQKSVYPGEQTLLIDLDMVNAVKRPVLLASAAKIHDVQAKDNQYIFVCRAPAGTVNVLDILMPGKPKYIILTDAQGRQIPEFEQKWYGKDRVCYLKFINQADGVTVRVKW